ncbi:MAG: ATP-binding protein [Anaerolineae bacterium]|nr:ATP-binding protein [Anaerolineae bacterium]
MLGERLRAARHARFVGRSEEKELFSRALAAPELPFAVLHIFGPGGIGKSTLLQEFAMLCELAHVPAVYLDARSIDATPESFSDALSRMIGEASSSDRISDVIAEQPRYVILIDTFEVLLGLDDWLRENFLPDLPGNTLVVLAGRDPLTPAWRSDPGWQSLTRSIALRNLEPEESRQYLSRRQIPHDQHQAVLSFTYGHPLALSLVADVFAQRQDVHFQPEQVPDVVKTLLGQFVQKVPGPAHRAALEVCALIRITTESLLAEMLQIDDAHELFNWLHSLSFMDTGLEGLFPHDLAREALLTDLRWRNPEWYAELHRRARRYYIARLQGSAGQTQQRLLFDLIFLHRDNVMVRPLFEWQIGGQLSVDSLQPGDLRAIVEIVARWEGDEAARLASYWLSRQPDGVLVLRDDKRQVVGFVLMLALHRTTREDSEVDPAVRAAMAFLHNQAPLRQGETATLFRFWMGRDTYQGVSPIQSLIFVNIVRHYLTAPGLAYTLLPCADPEFWQAGFAYADLARLPQADFTLGDQRYGVYGHDWRAVPPSRWLDLLGEREIGLKGEATAPPAVEQVIVLSAAEFAQAVQAALRDYARPDLLRGNPLLHSRLVLEKVGSGANEAERINTLRTLVRDVADSLQQSPRDTKFYRPLYHTYLQPAPTQEQAAELLDLPFSSFRRHLKSGITRVTEILWSQEIGILELD